MAKPYEQFAGNGMHTHFSVLGAQGQNVFDDGTEGGSAMLRHAVAGCLEALPDLTLIFAPHANSYDRLVPERHAPTGIAWAYENRTAAIRIPSGSPKARRIEHRVSGGDVNPYLMIAAILGSALDGIERRLEPPPPIEGNAYALDLPQIPDTWEGAVAAFERSALVPRIFQAELVRNYLQTKKQEIHYMAELSEAEQVELYLDTV
jgi:glutamine synthetase